MSDLKRLNHDPNRETKYLAIYKKGRYQMMAIEELLYIKGAGIYAELYFKNGTKEIHNKNLDKISQLLPTYFDRIHKSYIINNKEIKALLVEPGSKYTLMLNNEIQVPISRSKYKSPKREMGDLIIGATFYE